MGVWGDNGTRVVAAESYWRQPLKWDKEAAAAGVRKRVFCASLADVFEDWQGAIVNSNGLKLWKAWHADSVIASADRPKPRFSPMTMGDVRRRLFALIDATPNLDWLLLTKRPENVVPMVNAAARSSSEDASDRIIKTFIDRIWLGTTVENQKAADERIPILLQTPAAVRFLSCEPLLEAVDLCEWLYTMKVEHNGDGDTQEVSCRPDIHWVIVGGESGPRARPFDLAWARSLRDQCNAADVPFFMKQMGSKPLGDYYDDREYYEAQLGREWPDASDWNHRDGQPPIGSHAVLPLFDRHGADHAEWPRDLRIQQFPESNP